MTTCGPTSIKAPQIAARGHSTGTGTVEGLRRNRPPPHSEVDSNDLAETLAWPIRLYANVWNSFMGFALKKESDISQPTTANAISGLLTKPMFGSKTSKALLPTSVWNQQFHPLLSYYTINIAGVIIVMGCFDRGRNNYTIYDWMLKILDLFLESNKRICPELKLRYSAACLF